MDINHSDSSNIQIYGISLVCPKCKTKLFLKNSHLTCSNCNQSHEIRDGIPIFFPQLDPFYEGRFTQTHRIYPRIIQKYPWLSPLWKIFFNLNIIYRPMHCFIKIVKNADGFVLDIACGGGTEWFTRLGYVIGMDISLQSLKLAQAIYPEVIQGNILELPFPENSLDFVIGSHIIGHLPSEEKIQLLGEIQRILKPGGKLIFFAETKSNNLCHRFAKKYPDLFQKFFIQEPGHYGLEYGRVLFQKIESLGFQPVMIKKLYGKVWAVEHYLNYFPEEFANRSAGFCLFRSMCNIVFRIPPLHHGVNCLLGIIAPVVLFFESPDSIQEWFSCHEKKP